MSKVKDFFAELGYYCSSANTKSRGFYLTVVISFCIALLITLVGFVCSAIGLVAGAMRVIGFVGFPVVIILAVITGIWLYSNNG